MKLFERDGNGGNILLAEIEVESESAELIDNKGNELYQPKIVRRTITGKSTYKKPTLPTIYENDSDSLQIDYDNYLPGHTSLSIKGRDVTIIADQFPLLSEETSFDEDQYLDRVKARNCKQKVEELIEKLKQQKSGLRSDVTTNDIRELLEMPREPNFDDIVSSEKCDGMITILNPLFEPNRIDADLNKKH